MLAAFQLLCFVRRPPPCSPCPALHTRCWFLSYPFPFPFLPFLPSFYAALVLHSSVSSSCLCPLLFPLFSIIHSFISFILVFTLFLFCIILFLLESRRRHSAIFLFFVPGARKWARTLSFTHTSTFDFHIPNAVAHQPRSKLARALCIVLYCTAPPSLHSLFTELRCLRSKRRKLCVCVSLFFHLGRL